MREVGINEVAQAHWEWVESRGLHTKKVSGCLKEIKKAVIATEKQVSRSELSSTFTLEFADIILRCFDLGVTLGLDIEVALGMRVDLNILMAEDKDSGRLREDEG